MAEPSTANGLDELRERVVVRNRTVRPPRHPVVREAKPVQPNEGATSGSADVPGPPDVEMERAPDAPPAPPPAPALPPTQPRTGSPEEEVRAKDVVVTREVVISPLGLADQPTVNLAGRVRSSLGLRLDHVVLDLRVQGVRSSKAELLEMLLFELPEQATPDLRERLERFREATHRR